MEGGEREVFSILSMTDKEIFYGENKTKRMLTIGKKRGLLFYYGKGRWISRLLFYSKEGRRRFILLEKKGNFRE